MPNASAMSAGAVFSPEATVTDVISAVADFIPPSMVNVSGILSAASISVSKAIVVSPSRVIEYSPFSVRSISFSLTFTLETA